MYIRTEADRHQEGIEPLSRDSHWWEVVWGIPYSAWAAYHSAGYFHPSQAPAEDSLRERQPELAAWLDRELPGRWRFVGRSALYFNDKRNVWHECVFLFDTREDGVRFVEAQGHAVVRSRLRHWTDKIAEAERAREQLRIEDAEADERARAQHQEDIRTARAGYEYLRGFGVDYGWKQPKAPKPERRHKPWTPPDGPPFQREREAAERMLALTPALLVPVLVRETPPLVSNKEKWFQGGDWETRKPSAVDLRIQHTEQRPDWPAQSPAGGAGTSASAAVADGGRRE